MTYDKRDLLVRPNTDLINILKTESPIYFREHEIRVTMINNQATRVTFRGVPIKVPYKELIHLCSLNGDLINDIVHRQFLRLGSNSSHSIFSSTRYVEVRLFPGKPLKNYYWLMGPSPGERGMRVTVLHSNEPSQCGWCF